MKVFTVLLILFSIGTLFTVQSPYTPSQETSTTTTSTITTCTWRITVSTDKSAYSPNETVVVSGTVTMCTSDRIIVELELRDPLNAVVYSKSLFPARLPDEPPILPYSDSFNLSSALLSGTFQVNARAIWNGYPAAQASSSFQLEGGSLSVNFDKTTYYAGDTVHITGGIIYTPDCTWTYTSAGGLAVAVTIHDPNGLLVVNSTTNPSAAGYKQYAYDYALPANAIRGSYTVTVYHGSCGGGCLRCVFGRGTFLVASGTANMLTYDVQDLLGYPYFALPPDANVLGVKLKFYRDVGNHPNGSVIEARFAQFWFRDYRILVAWADEPPEPVGGGNLFYCTMEITFDRVANHVSPAPNPDPLADAIAPGLITGFRETWRAFPTYDVKYISQAPSFPEKIYKYLIITDEAWHDAVQPFIQLKAGLGMPVLAVSRQWIDATYSGDSLQQKIWYFLRDAYNRWEPSYLLIAGDVNAVPTWTMRRSSLASRVETSDWNFAFLDGDINGYDDMLPEIIVSRLPARDKDSLFDMLSKTVDYHKAPQGEWTRRALLIAGEDYLVRKTYFIETMNNFAKDYIPAQMTITRLYAGYNLTADNIVSEINKGAAIVVVNAHGSSTGFEPFYVGDVARLSNGPMLPLVDTFSCGLAPYNSTSGDYWALAMLRNRTGGAVALVGATTPIMIATNTMEDGPHLAPYWYTPLLFGERHPIFSDWWSYSYLYEHILFRPFRLGDNYLFAAIMDGSLGWSGGLPARNYFGDPDMSLLGFESRDASLDASAYWSPDGNVTVRALDRNTGNPIPGMVVRVVASESFYFESSTDENGTIEFKLPEILLQSGRVDITAYALNYNAATRATFTINQTPSFGFEISLPQPSSQTIQQGGSATFAITVTTTSGVPQEVTLGIDDLPQSSSVSWAPSNVLMPSTTGSTVEFTIQTSSSTPAQTYADLRVSGSGGGSPAKSPAFTLAVAVTTPAPPPGPRCIIATAAYGSEMAPDVVYMRYVRDNLIGSSTMGRRLVAAFNAFYYSWSPAVAKAIAGSELLRAAFRVVLLPLVGIVYVTAHTFMAVTSLGGFTDLASAVAFLVAVAMTLAVYVAFPLLVALEIRQTSRRRRAC